MKHWSPSTLLTICFSIAILTLSGCASSPADKPAEWTTLFDGKTLQGWKILGGSATYEVVDGAIEGTTVLNTPNTFLVTEKDYSDFILELEVRIDDTAINSGIQIRSHVEELPDRKRVYGKQVEMDPSSRGWSAGIYDEGRRGWLYPLSLNPEAARQFKVKEFNHIRIECIGRETKTWINGRPAAYVADTLDQEGFIGLQVHSVDSQHVGKKVYFRNIRIQTEDLRPAPFENPVFVANLLPNTLTAYELDNGWIQLFDGSTSRGWRSVKDSLFPQQGWKTDNGALTVIASGGKESKGGGDIITTGMYGAFDFAFSFRLNPGANSGVKYFVTLREKTEGSAIGLEYQVLDDDMHPDAKMGNNGNRTMASLYDLIPADKQKRFLRPVGAWNDGRIVVHPDNRVEHFLNGNKVLEYQRGSEEFRKLVAISKYKNWPDFGEAAEGHLLLQDHGDEVSYTNLKLRKL